MSPMAWTQFRVNKPTETTGTPSSAPLHKHSFDNLISWCYLFQVKLLSKDYSFNAENGYLDDWLQYLYLPQIPNEWRE